MDPILQLYQAVLGVVPHRASGWPEAAEALKAGNRVQLRGNPDWSGVVLLEPTEGEVVEFYHPVQGARRAAAETFRALEVEFWMIARSAPPAP